MNQTKQPVYVIVRDRTVEINALIEKIIQRCAFMLESMSMCMVDVRYRDSTESLFPKRRPILFPNAMSQDEESSGL